jgi:hopanoid C-3 methylase
MKVLLLRPPLPRRTIGAAHASLCEPLELAVLAGNLRDNDVTVLDMRVDPTPFDEVLQRVKPDIVGVTAGTVEVRTASALLRRVKEVFPAVATIVGGPHATARPEDFAGSFVNAIVLGLGVSSFREIVIAREKGRPLEEIAGLVVNQKGGKQLRTPRRDPVPSLGLFPAPDRKCTAKYRSKYYHAWVKPVALVQGSAGSNLPGTVGAPPTEERIVQEAERVAAEMVEQESGICLADDDALVEPQRVARICALLKEASFEQPLYLCTRAEAIVENPEVIEDLSELGLNTVALSLDGPERNGPSAAQVRAVDVLHANGVSVSGELIISPSFDAEDFRRAGEIARELNIEFPIFSVTTPFPGTPLFEKYRDLIGLPDWEIFDRVHAVLPTRLPLRKFYAELSRLYERSYGLASIPRVQRALPWRSLPVMATQLARFSRRVRGAYIDQEKGLHS